MIALPFIATFFNVCEQIASKYLLSRLKTPVEQFHLQIFPILFVLSILALPFDWRLDWLALRAPALIAQLGGVIALGALWNILYFRGFKREHIEEVEIFRQFRPIIMAGMAAIFFAAERNPKILFAVTASTLVLFVSHLSHYKFRWSPATPYLFGGIFAMGLQLILIKNLLTYFSPAVLFAIYTGALALFFDYVPHPEFRDNPTQMLTLVLIGVFATAAVLLLFHSIQIFGIGLTSMVLLFEPVLLYAGARFFLHERLHLNKVLAGLVIALIVVFVVLQ